MIYIKIDDKSYLNDDNLRKILSVSGEVIGTFDVEVTSEGAKIKTNIVLDENVFELTPEMYPEIIDNICHNAVFDLSQNKIIKKIENSIFQEIKIKKKNDLLNKGKNDPDFMFEKEDTKDIYKAVFDDIERAITKEELNLIEI